MSNGETMDADLHPEVAAQIDSLSLMSGRALVISDADEVLFAFMAGFEGYLETQQLYFDWRSFALTGNIRHRTHGMPLTAEEVKETLDAFFSTCTETLAPVPGAAQALNALRRDGAQIVVLSNIPLDRIEARQRALVKHGMEFPLIANIGSKGAAVKRLTELTGGPAAFLDDIPHHHTAVAAAAEQVLRLHFVADPRLAKLLGPAEHCHHRTDGWPEAHRLMARYFAAGSL